MDFTLYGFKGDIDITERPIASCAKQRSWRWTDGA